MKARGTSAGAPGGRLRIFAVAEIRTACALVRAILHVSIPHVTSTFKPGALSAVGNALRHSPYPSRSGS